VWCTPHSIGIFSERILDALFHSCWFLSHAGSLVFKHLNINDTVVTGHRYRNELFRNGALQLYNINSWLILSLRPVDRITIANNLFLWVSITCKQSLLTLWQVHDDVGLIYKLTIVVLDRECCSSEKIRKTVWLILGINYGSQWSQYCVTHFFVFSRYYDMSRKLFSIGTVVQNLSREEHLYLYIMASIIQMWYNTYYA